ncbi:MAG: thioredoxin family protein [Krumholzibacteria bacterium]|nr:thioredoxin family protein [Candidatus Krumholzibacteria bacterium]
MTSLRHLLPVLGLVLAADLMPSRAPSASAQVPATAAESRHVRWESHREAEARSLAEQKPLLIHFTAPWSGWCKKMQRETYADRRVVRYLNEHFAMAMVDTDKLPAMARKFAVEGPPTLWFLEPGGRRLTHLAGYTSADNLLPLLEFIVARDYEWTDYGTWLKRRR